jgi:type II secretory pathway pseudopilin PulG
MKNNQGFTLLGALAIAALLSVVAVTGMSIVNQNAKKEEANKIATQGNRLISNVTESAGSSVAAIGKAQFQNLPNADLTDPQNPNNPDSELNPNGSNNPNDPNNVNNPNNPSNPANPNFATPTPVVPNCHRVPTPAEQATGIIAWNDGDLLQCGCAMNETCQIEPIGINNTCPSPKTPQCLCPGGLSDCPDVPVCGPGYVLTPTGPWSSTCAPFGTGSPAGPVNDPIAPSL